MTKQNARKSKGNLRKKSNKRNSKSSSKRRSQRGGNPMKNTNEHPPKMHMTGGNPMKNTNDHPPKMHMAGGNPMKNTNEHPPKMHMAGGSPASSLVMSAFDSPPVMNDYVVDPRISNSDANGGDIGGCQFGGGEASDMVLSQLNDVAQTASYPEGYKVTGDINSLNLYAPSGGAKKSNDNNNMRNNKKRSNKKRSNKNRNKKTRSNKHSSKKNKHVMRGGHASDWISSQYSLGSVNGASMDSNTGDFSNSQGVSRDIIMNPPTLGLAGSGYPMGALEGANVSSVGAPLA